MAAAEDTIMLLENFLWKEFEDVAEDHVHIHVAPKVATLQLVCETQAECRPQAANVIRVVDFDRETADLGASVCNALKRANADTDVGGECEFRSCVSDEEPVNGPVHADGTEDQWGIVRQLPEVTCQQGNPILGN